MNYFDVLLLAFIQGVVEFFPVSSSAHLILVRKIFEIKELNFNFDIFLHMGTTFSIIVFFWKDLLKIFNFLVSFPKLLSKFSFNNLYLRHDIFNLFINLMISTILTGLVGVLLKLLCKNLVFPISHIGYMLFITGTILLFAQVIKTKKRKIKRLKVIDSFIIGIAQGLAFLPGLSRLGLTFSMAILLGLGYRFSLKYSFFLSIPSIVGVFILDFSNFNFKKILIELDLVIIGIFISFLVGIFFLKFLFFFVNKKKLYLFSIYCYTIAFILFFKKFHI